MNAIIWEELRMEDNAGQSAGENASIPGNASLAKRPRWYMQPWKLLAAALAAPLFIYCADYAATLVFTSIWNAAGAAYDPAGRSLMMFTVFTVFLPTAVELAVAAAFYLLVRVMHRKSWLPGSVSWKVDAAFWVGLALMLARMLLDSLPIRDSLSPIFVLLPAFLRILTSGFIMLLFVILLFPVFEARFGSIRGALVLGLAFALSTVLEQALALSLNWLNAYITLGHSPGRLLESSASNIAPGIVSACIAAFCWTVLWISLYLSASRRIPGAWMLFSSVPGLLGLLCRALETLLIRNIANTTWIRIICIEFPFYLLVSALSLALIAGLRRWKTLGEFLKDAKGFMRRTDTDID